ncbi:hypothetical protein WNY97_18595 [Pseudoalteromonas fuliginea]|uniref:hypothetical protein n=1 Tax=Pseudoalteromonas fuliginea TaxID=1872678 RepID=UPI00317D1BE7
MQPAITYKPKADAFNVSKLYVYNTSKLLHQTVDARLADVMGEVHKNINAISLQLHINQKLRFSREQASRFKK